MTEYDYRMIKVISGTALFVLGAAGWIVVMIALAHTIKGLPGGAVLIAGVLLPVAGAYAWSSYKLDRIRKLEAVKDKFRN